MVLKDYLVEDLFFKYSFIINGGGTGNPVIRFLRDYVYGKVLDSLWEGFKDACQNGHKADPGSKCMHTALHYNKRGIQLLLSFIQT